MTSHRQIGPLIRVALPVAVAAVLVCLAIVNVALVKTWYGELDDGALWRSVGENVVADDIAPGYAADRAGLEIGDTLVAIDGQEVRRVDDVLAALHASDGTRPLKYTVSRSGADLPISVDLLPMPTVNGRLYLLARARRHSVDRDWRVGAAAAAERSRDAAFLLADGRVLRRARVHAGGPLQPSRLLLRMGGCGRAPGAAPALPALRVRVSRTAPPVGQDRPRARRRPGAVPARAADRHGARHAGGRRPARHRVDARARAAGALRLRVSGHLPARRPAPDASRADAPAVGDRAPAAALDRLGIGGRRAALRRAVHPAAALRARAPVRGVHRRCCSAASRSRSRRRSCGTG